jgi:hypothetical protein
MNKPEIERLIKKYKRMRHAKHFQMPYYAIKTDCGTACCIAGQELLDRGYRPEWDKPTGFTTPAARTFITPDGCVVLAFTAARRELGLTQRQAGRLFDKSLWPDDLRAQPDSPRLAAERLQRFLDTNGRQ